MDCVLEAKTFTVIPNLKNMQKKYTIKYLTKNWKSFFVKLTLLTLMKGRHLKVLSHVVYWCGDIKIDFS